MPCFQAHQPAPLSSSPPDGESPFCNMPHFRAHQPVPPSSSPPESESLFPVSYISELTNMLLPPLPPMKPLCFFLLPFISDPHTTSPSTSPILSFLPLHSAPPPPSSRMAPFLQFATFPSSPTRSSLFLLSSK